MTFYESALRVLEEAGRPLTHVEITQLSMGKGLLSHVGKMPELTMLARLAAMAKRPRDRKLTVTAKDTFALIDWMLPEDAAALATTGVPEVHPEEGLPPLRPIERHPEPAQANVRGVGRQGDRDRKRGRDRDRGDRDEGKRRFPPLAEVAFETLEELGGSAAPAALLEKARAKEQCGPDLAVEALLYALVEDNQRRIDAGRKPQFHWRAPEGAEPMLAVDPNSELPAGEVQAALCKAANVAYENGRAVLRVREERVSALSPEDLQLVDNARLAVKDARRAQARIFKKHLADLELGAFEKAIVKLLHTQGFREVRVARRSKDGLLMTSRRKDGSLEYKQAIRLLRGHATIERRHVQELRRDLSQVGAQVGLICSAGDVRGDARSDATGQGAMVQIWGGDALAEKFFDAEAGVTVKKMYLFEIDESFFTQAKSDADEARVRREERQRERGDEGSRDAAANGDAEGATPFPAPTSPAPQAVDGPADGDSDEGDDDEEGPEEPGQAAAGGAPGADGAQGKRRRRRRRRRRGGAGREGVPGAPGAPGQTAAGAGEGGGAPAPAAAAPPPPPSAPAPSGGESSGS